MDALPPLLTGNYFIALHISSKIFFSLLRYHHGHARTPVEPGLGSGAATIGHPGKKPFIRPALRIS
jgi:hypothetical protein